MDVELLVEPVDVGVDRLRTEKELPRNLLLTKALPPSCGQAYYDLFTYENRALEQDQDTVKN